MKTFHLSPQARQGPGHSSNLICLLRVAFLKAKSRFIIKMISAFDP